MGASPWPARVSRPMNLSAPVKVLALLVFLAALAGATYGVQQVLGDGVEGQLVGAQAARTTLSATPGHTVSFPLVLSNRDTDVRGLVAVVSGEGIEGRAPMQRIPAAGNGTVFVPVRVPDGLAPGDHPLSVRLVDESGKTLRERPDVLTLRVLAPGGPVLAAGEVGQVVYTGRLAESGRVFASNDVALRGSPLLRTETFQPGSAPINVSTLGSPALPRGAVEALVGMAEGETRTLTLEPDQAFGNATIEERVNRTVVLERREELPLPTASLSTAEFAAYLNETGQGVPADFEVGDVVLNVQETETLRYRVVESTAQGVKLRLSVEVGERYTVYDFWPNGSEVQEVTETSAVFYTTPTQEEKLTYYDYWPELTRVAALNETSVTLSHDPKEGLKFSQAAGQFQQVRQYTVASVGEKEIVMVTPSNNPLAGQRLTYDLTLVGIRR